MSVPNTTTFSQKDVIAELGIFLNSSLQSCFDNAVDADFDPLYKGSKNSLLNFRNYSKSGINSIAPTSVVVSSSSGNFIVTVTSSTTWVVSAGASWLSVSPAFGSGNGSFTVNYLTNLGSPRADEVQVTFTGGATLTVDIEQV